MKLDEIKLDDASAPQLDLDLDFGNPKASDKKSGDDNFCFGGGWGNDWTTSNDTAKDKNSKKDGAANASPWSTAATSKKDGTSFSFERYGGELNNLGAQTKERKKDEPDAW